VEVGITQEKLAWDCDLAKPYLSQVESGKRIPSVPVLALLAKRLGVELADIVAVRPKQPRLALLEAARRRDRTGVHAALELLDLAEEPQPERGEKREG
jgi:transcriptional regulator with XRE-family HTH domain